MGWSGARDFAADIKIDVFGNWISNWRRRRRWRPKNSPNLARALIHHAQEPNIPIKNPSLRYDLWTGKLSEAFQIPHFFREFECFQIAISTIPMRPQFKISQTNNRTFTIINRLGGPKLPWRWLQVLGHECISYDKARLCSSFKQRPQIERQGMPPTFPAYHRHLYLLSKVN